MSKGSRKIKCLGNSVDTNEYYLHPITLNLGKNVAPHKICPSDIHYKNGKIRLTIADNNTSLTDKDIKSFMALPYLNLDTEQCSDRCMFLFYKNNHYDLIKFNYNKQSIIENKINKKIQNETKYYTIFNKNDLPPPLHILLLIFGSYYINLEDSAKKKFKFYKYLFDGFNESLNKQLAILNNTEFNKSFIPFDFFGSFRFLIIRLTTSAESDLFVPITPIGPRLAQPTTYTLCSTCPAILAIRPFSILTP